MSDKQQGEDRFYGPDKVSPERGEAEGHVMKYGPEVVKAGPEDKVGPEKQAGRDEEPDVEGHVMKYGPEQAFGTEGAAEAQRMPHPIRPEDDPDPADGKF